AGIPGRGRISAAEVERLRRLRLAIHRLFSLPHPSAEDLEALRETVADAMEAAAMRPWAGGHSARRAAGGGFPPAIAPSWPRSDERRVRFAGAWGALLVLGGPGRLARVARRPGRRCGRRFV